jgi:tripeptidyl-peptidase-2
MQKRALVLNTSLDGDAAALYKVAKAGDTLFGKLRLGAASSKAEVALSYILPDQAKEDSDEEKDEDTPLLVDLQLTIVDKIKDESEKTKFLDNLLKDKSNHIPLLVARLEALKDEASAQDVNSATDAILAQIDEAKLAEYYGKKALATHEQKKQDKRLKKEMDTKKSAWTLAHARKLKASLKSDERRRQQDALFAKYRQFIESPDKDEEFILISAKRDMERQVSCTLVAETAANLCLLYSTMAPLSKPSLSSSRTASVKTSTRKRRIYTSSACRK